jgi:hypothetical protein
MLPRETKSESAKPGLDIPDSIKTLILKLRWIGLEDEAESLYSHLVRMAPGEGADLWPHETD